MNGTSVCSKVLVVHVALAVACSSPSASRDASVASVDACKGGTASPQYFVDKGWCRSSYADAIAHDSCFTDCGGYHVVGGQTLYSEIDCFYDEVDGALVGGYWWSDDAPSCTAGVGHDACPSVPWCADGGAH